MSGIDIFKTSVKINNKRIKIQSENQLSYFLDETCPICGIYTPDGDVCVNCQKSYDVYKPKNTYTEV